MDTGAQYTVIASDVLKPGVLNANEDRMKLRGTAGSSFETMGVVHALLSYEGKKTIDVEMHVMDRKYTQVSDGFFGFDSLSAHNISVDMINKKLIFE